MLGNQTPRIQIEPQRAETEGPGAVMLMQAYGVKLDAWQELILNSILGTDGKGHYVTTSSGISVGRQNGKSEILISRCFYGLVINGERIIFSAHQTRSVKKIFFRLEQMFTDKRHPEIIEEVKRIRYGAGEESIELKNGGVIEFMARSRQAARGYDGISLVIFDEAQDLTEEQAESLTAVLSSSKTGTRQMIYAGTAPYTGCNADVFKRLRESCLLSAERGENTRSSWHEWSPAGEQMQDIDISDVNLWYQCNPALGGRLSEEFTREELKALSPLGFARERLNAWLKPKLEEQEAAIDEALFMECASDQERPEGKTAFGVKFTADGTEVILAGAVVPEDGPARITLIAIEPIGKGLNWLANWLNERYKTASCVVIDGKNGADVLIDKMQNVWTLKGTVIKPTGAQMVTAANMLINDLREHSLTWYRKQEELKESALTSNKRPISGGFGFGGAFSGPIEACSLALYGARTSKRNPGKKMRIG